MIRTRYYIKKSLIVFSRWSRKNNAIFLSLSKQIKIAHLKFEMIVLADKKHKIQLFNYLLNFNDLVEEEIESKDFEPNFMNKLLQFINSLQIKPIYYGKNILFFISNFSSSIFITPPISVRTFTNINYNSNSIRLLNVCETDYYYIIFNKLYIS